MRANRAKKRKESEDTVVQNNKVRSSAGNQAEKEKCLLEFFFTKSLNDKER